MAVNYGFYQKNYWCSIVSLINEKENTHYLVRELAGQVKHIATSIDNTQLQINELVKANSNLTIQMTKWVERENWKDKRIANLEESDDKQSHAIAELEIFVAETKLISKLGRFLSTAFVATLSSISASIVVFLLIKK